MSRILLGVLYLFVSVIAGTIIGSVLDYKGWTCHLSFILKPFLRFARLPSICGSSFITSIFSNNAASAILAGARTENSISRREMIAAAVINTMPIHTFHLSKAMFLLVPLIGPVAFVYYLIVLICNLIKVFLVLVFNRLLSKRREEIGNPVDSVKQYDITWVEILNRTKRRVWHIVKKLLLIFVPLYIFVLYLSYSGFFDQLNMYMPNFITGILSPEEVSIAISKLGSLTASATVANSLLQNGNILEKHVLVGLLVGNLLTIPFSAVRRNLPAALAIFPGKDGFFVVVIAESIRFALNLAAVVVCVVI